jgi:hypothetical protein
MKLYSLTYKNNAKGIYYNTFVTGPFVEPPPDLAQAPSSYIPFSRGHYLQSEGSPKTQGEYFANLPFVAAFRDLLSVEHNQITSLYTRDTGQLVGYNFVPASLPNCSDYPNYAEVEATRLESIHFFLKNRTAPENLYVTEPFVLRIKQHHFTGLYCMLKWDGQRVVGLDYD